MWSVCVSSWTSEMWMALGADPVVANRIFEMVIEKLLVMAPYVDQRESMIRGGTRKVATCQPLAVSQTLRRVTQDIKLARTVGTICKTRHIVN